MHEFSQFNNLGSYFIDVPLLKKLEGYIKSDLPKIVNVAQENEIKYFQCQYSITIRSAKNEETFNSAEEYKLSNFNNDIKSVSIDYNLYHPDYKNRIGIKISFSMIDKDCELVIKMTDDYPSEKVAAIQSGILELIESNRRTKWSYSFIPLILFSASMIYSFCIDLLFRQLYKHLGIYIGAFVLLGLGLIVINKLKGSCAFDNKRQRIKDQWSSWAATGFATFILFGTILYSIRKIYYGF